MDHDNRDRFDELLDSALKRHLAAMPPEGMEQRLLQSLRRNPVPRRQWMPTIAITGAVAATLAVVLLMHAPKRQAHPLRATRTEVRNTRNINKPAIRATVAPERKLQSSVVARLHRAQRATVVSARMRRPFPTPAPLSAQEKLLMQFIARAPSAEIVRTVAYHSQPLARLTLVPVEIKPLRVAPIGEPAIHEQ